ncbi:MAG: glutamyl-tRNA reductase [Gammaproteobacteria bacterium]
MNFFICGINHKTAPLAIRERLAFNDVELVSILLEAHKIPYIGEIIILSTCNRTEFYYFSPQPCALFDWLTDKLQIGKDQLLNYLYYYYDRDAIKHAMRVANGLDSMIIGEPQILGQFKKAYQIALEHGTVLKKLSSLFQHIFRTAKRVHRETHISKHSSSLVSTAMKLIQQHQDIKHKRVLVIGYGEIAKLAIKYLAQHELATLTIANRSTINFVHDIVSCAHISLEQVTTAVYRSDIVISATASNTPILTHQKLTTLKPAKQYPITMVDLAVPRDIDPAVACLPYVTLYNVDDLQKLLANNQTNKQAAIQQAEAIIEEAINHYLCQHYIASANSTIRAYHEYLSAISQQEIAQALQELKKSSMTPELVIEKLMYRTLKKIAHSPSVTLRQAGLEGKEELLNFANLLLGTKLNNTKVFSSTNRNNDEQN